MYHPNGYVNIWEKQKLQKERKKVQLKLNKLTFGVIFPFNNSKPDSS